MHVTYHRTLIYLISYSFECVYARVSLRDVSPPLLSTLRHPHPIDGFAKALARRHDKANSIRLCVCVVSLNRVPAIGSSLIMTATAATLVLSANARCRRHRHRYTTIISYASHYLRHARRQTTGFIQIVFATRVWFHKVDFWQRFVNRRRTIRDDAGSGKCLMNYKFTL